MRHPPAPFAVRRALLVAPYGCGRVTCSLALVSVRCALLVAPYGCQFDGLFTAFGLGAMRCAFRTLRWQGR